MIYLLTLPRIKAIVWKTHWPHISTRALNDQRNYSVCVLPTAVKRHVYTDAQQCGKQCSTMGELEPVSLIFSNLLDSFTLPPSAAAFTADQQPELLGAG
jgi:hypothetical protein